jgi:hypothetical protein
MVEFCTFCGTSLPKGDLTVKAGKLFTSHDYSCPSCGKIANPDKAAAGGQGPSPDRDIVFRQGQATNE